MSKMTWSTDLDPETHQRQCERRYVVLDHDGVQTLYPDTLAGAARLARDNAPAVVAGLLLIAVVLVMYGVVSGAVPVSWFVGLGNHWQVPVAGMSGPLGQLWD